MRKEDIRRLAEVEERACVSMTVPVSSLPERQAENQIRFKNLLQEAGRKLEEEAPELADAMVKKIESLWRENCSVDTVDGALALFAGPDMAKIYRLPVGAMEKVVVGNRFSIRDLLYALDRSVTYYLLTLSESRAELYHGYNSNLEPVTDRFPLEHVIYEAPVEKVRSSEPAGQWLGGRGLKRLSGDAVATPGIYVRDVQTQEDERLRKFFRLVDLHLFQAIQENCLPVLIYTTRQNYVVFKELSQNNLSIADVIYGAPHKLSLSDLKASVRPYTVEIAERETECALAGLEKARSRKLYAAGLQECWQLARQGRIERLFVERRFEKPAFELAGGSVSESVPAGARAIRQVERAVGETITSAFLSQAGISFVDPGQLGAHNHLAAILRY
ncbi:MAG: hypothetical protein IPM23_12660 [Candidatus Melainabacteria bacterium]|nr:hypothetical protein [Candidatus Melainabacteria bacterium]